MANFTFQYIHDLIDTKMKSEWENRINSKYAVIFPLLSEEDAILTVSVSPDGTKILGAALCPNVSIMDAWNAAGFNRRLLDDNNYENLNVSVLI